ncbi:MAG TPA: metalloregulator ArsR/SmtB family transcription factor [Thermoanaerobaculia bacterium]
MVKYSEPLDATFSALADPTRRAILARLALGQTSVTELAHPFAISLPAVSKHLRVLERAGLLARFRDGRVHRCQIEAEPMRAAADWIARYRGFWEDRLDALDRYLKETGQELETPAAVSPVAPMNPRARVRRSKGLATRKPRRR